MAHHEIESRADTTNPVTGATCTADGISFRIEARSGSHDFEVKRDTLDIYAAHQGIDTSDADNLEVFHAFRTTIARAAQSLLRKGSGKDCVLTLSAFRDR